MRLQYYLNQRQGRKRGSLTLSSDAKVSGGLQKSERHNFFRFEVFSASGGVILLAGETAQEVKNWVEKLNEAIASAPAPGTAPNRESEHAEVMADSEIQKTRMERWRGAGPDNGSQQRQRRRKSLATGRWREGRQDLIGEAVLVSRPTFRRNFLAKDGKVLHPI